MKQLLSTILTIALLLTTIFSVSVFTASAAVTTNAAFNSINYWQTISSSGNVATPSDTSKYYRPIADTQLKDDVSVNTIKMTNNNAACYMTKLKVESNKKYKISFDYYAESLSSNAAFDAVGVAPLNNGEFVYRTYKTETPVGLTTVCANGLFNNKAYVSGMTYDDTTIKTVVTPSADHWYSLSFEFDSANNTEVQFYITTKYIASATSEVANFELAEVKDITTDTAFNNISNWQTISSSGNVATPSDTSKYYRPIADTQSKDGVSVNTIKMTNNNAACYMTKLKVESNKKYKISFDYYAESLSSNAAFDAVGVAPLNNGEFVYRTYKTETPVGLTTVCANGLFNNKAYVSGMTYDDTTIKTVVTPSADNWYSLSFEFDSANNTEVQFYITTKYIQSATSEVANFELVEVDSAGAGSLMYEGFEKMTTNEEVEEVIYHVSDKPWVEPKLCVLDAATGQQSMQAYGMYQNLYVPLDKSLFKVDSTYEYSMNWKMLEYTEAKHRRLSVVQLVGWDSDFATRADLTSDIDDIPATGDWENIAIRFKWLSSFADYTNIGIRISYSTSEPYTAAEDTIYLDDFKLTETEDLTVLPPELPEDERTEDTIKVLAFGNSFSCDSTIFIDDIVAADKTDLRVGNAYIGGCSLEKHYGNISAATKDYTFEYFDLNGQQTYKGVSMEEALKATDWDYITLQQVSGLSGQADTFEPYLKGLIDYFKQVCPDAEILLHATWAYAADSTHQDFPNYDSDQTKMHEAIEDAYLKASQDYGFVRIIPTGEAIRRARATTMGDNFDRDGYHLNDEGRIIAALTWYETFTGISALDTKFDLSTAIKTLGGLANQPVAVTAEEDLIMRTAAHEAVQLFKKANETQLAIEAIGTVTKESGEAIEKANALRAELGDDSLLPNLQTLIDANDAYAEFVPDVVVGDVSGDNVTDLQDVTLLAQAIAGWDVTVNEQALDSDGDGEVNLNDLVLLAQFVAGWDVVLG